MCIRRCVGCVKSKLRQKSVGLIGMTPGFRPQLAVTAGFSGLGTPAGTSDPFRTSIRDAVTRRVLGVTRTGAAFRSRRSTTQARTEGIGNGNKDEDHRGSGARVHGAIRTRGGAVGRRRAWARTARTSERAEDMDRASAGRRRGRQANAVGVGRDVGRGRATNSTGVDRGNRGRRHGASVGADDADIRAGVPRGLCRTVEADDEGIARRQHAARHPAGFRLPGTQAAITSSRFGIFNKGQIHGTDNFHAD